MLLDVASVGSAVCASGSVCDVPPVLWRPTREDFLPPVRALSMLFRAKFRDALRQTELFIEVPAEAWTQDWVVHCQPVGDGAAALKYLAPYIFRVAISNRRILSLEGDQVTFGYTDGRSGQRKTCIVKATPKLPRCKPKSSLPAVMGRGPTRHNP